MPFASCALTWGVDPTTKGDFQVPEQVQLHSTARYPKAASARWTGRQGKQRHKGPERSRTPTTGSGSRTCSMIRLALSIWLKTLRQLALSDGATLPAPRRVFSYGLATSFFSSFFVLFVEQLESQATVLVISLMSGEK